MATLMEHFLLWLYQGGLVGSAVGALAVYALMTRRYPDVHEDWDGWANARLVAGVVLWPAFLVVITKDGIGIIREARKARRED